MLVLGISSVKLNVSKCLWVKSVLGLGTLYVEVLINRLVLGLIVLMESHFVMMMNLSVFSDLFS